MNVNDSEPQKHKGAGSLCLFASNARPLAVDLEVVDGVVEFDTLIGIPLCPPQVLGLSSYHREVVPVVQIEGQTPEVAEEPGAKLIALILRGKHGHWGLRIDQGKVTIVDAPSRSPAGAPLPPPLESGWPTIAGRFERTGETFDILDPEGSWRGLRDRIEHWYRLVGGRGPLPNEGRA